MPDDAYGFKATEAENELRRADESHLRLGECASTARRRIGSTESDWASGATTAKATATKNLTIRLRFLHRRSERT